MDANKCLLKRVCYDYPLRGPARALQKQRQMLAANHWTKYRVPNGGAGGRIGGADRVFSLM